MTPVKARALVNSASNKHFWILLIIVGVLFTLYIGYYRLPVDVLWFRELLLFEYSFNLRGLLFVIPILYSWLVFGVAGAITVWAIGLTAVLLGSLRLTVEYLVRDSILFLVPIVPIAIVLLQLKLRSKEKKLFEQHEKEREYFISQVINIQEEERRRLAQELHDNTVQDLMAIGIYAQTLLSSEDVEKTPRVAGQVKNIQDSILTVTEDVRKLSLYLRPAALDSLGFIPALRLLIDKFCERSKIKADLVVTGDERSIGIEREIVLFRIVQEALNNVRRHSGAKEVYVKLNYDSHFLRVTVEDNGTGFALPEKLSVFAAQGHLGLLGMKERARSLGSDLGIHSLEGKGTTVSLVIKT